MLLLTIGILFILFVVSYILFDKDIFCPPTVVCMVMLFGSLCTFYNEESWALNFSSYTTMVIAIGVGCFIIGGLLAMVIPSLFGNQKVGFSHIVSKVEPIEINKIKTFVIIVIQFITFWILLGEEQRITGESNWLMVVAKWRFLTGYNANLNDTSINLSGLLRFFLQINLVIGFLYAYIVGNNFVASKKQKFLDWLPVILCTIIIFLQAYRGDMIRIWVMILVISFTLKKRTTGWKNTSKIKKMIKRMGLSVLAVAVIFSVFRSAVGRTSDADLLSYVTFYAGCPIAGLDQYLKETQISSNIWGKETFFDLNQSIRWITGDANLKYIFYKDFIQSPNGTFIGNVYTALRPPYADFGGLAGMAFYMVIFGLFFTYLYSKIRNKYGKSPIDIRLLLYSYMSYTFFMFFYNLYNTFLTHLFLRMIIEILIMRWFLLGFRLKNRFSIRFILGKR